MIYTTRPLSDRTWLRPENERIRSRFDSTWSATLRDLKRELGYLDARNVVIEMDIREVDIRNDGLPRANARPATPAVAVAFESKHGPMFYRCDRLRASYRSSSVGWQENVRSIALTLEALRAVERYGAVDTGQQYAGFKALPTGRAMPASHMTRTQALTILGDWGRRRSRLPAIPAEHVNTDPDALRALWRTARREAHPDWHHGDQTAWDQVELAASVLGITP